MSYLHWKHRFSPEYSFSENLLDAVIICRHISRLKTFIYLILYSYLDSWSFCTIKNLFDGLATLESKEKTEKVNSTIVLGSQPSVPQVLAAIPAKLVALWLSRMQKMKWGFEVLFSTFVRCLERVFSFGKLKRFCQWWKIIQIMFIVERSLLDLQHF